MKKIILLTLLILTSIGNLTAQDDKSEMITDLKNYVDSISSKLNTLQHDYDYLYCNHEITIMKHEISDLSNSIANATNGILINCYHGSFDIDLYSAYRRNYNSSIDLSTTFKEKVEVIKTAVLMKIFTSGFTDEERSILMRGCDLLDSSLSQLQSSLDYYKIVLDIYKDL